MAPYEHPLTLRVRYSETDQMGIAYHAKPVVKKGAGQSISTLGLDSILYLVGVRDRDTLS